MRGDREEKRANETESRLSDIERFIRMLGASEAYEHWNFLHDVVKKAARPLRRRIYIPLHTDQRLGHDR